MERVVEGTVRSSMVLLCHMAAIVVVAVPWHPNPKPSSIVLTCYYLADGLHMMVLGLD